MSRTDPTTRESKRGRTTPVQNETLRTVQAEAKARHHGLKDPELPGSGWLETDEEEEDERSDSQRGADWAEVCLQAMPTRGYDAEPLPLSNMVKLITCLMHWCDREGVSFAAAQGIAAERYADEKKAVE